MKKSIIIILILTIFSIPYCFSQTEFSNDELVIIDDSSNLPTKEAFTKEVKKNAVTHLENIFKHHFKNAKYISSNDENYIDSIYTISDKAIKIKRRWFRKIVGGCCLVPKTCYSWRLNARISIKHKLEFDYFLENPDASQLANKVIEFYNRKDAAIPKIRGSIFIEKQEGEDLAYSKYINKLKKEFGMGRIIEISTFKNKRLLRPEDRPYTSVVFSLRRQEPKYIIEFIDSKSSKIIRTDQ